MTRGISPKICILCVCVIINKCSIEPFCVWSLYDYTYVRLKALHMKHYNKTQPNLIMHYISHSIPPFSLHPHMRTHPHPHTHNLATPRLPISLPVTPHPQNAHTHARTHACTRARTHARTHTHTQTQKQKKTKTTTRLSQPVKTSAAKSRSNQVLFPACVGRSEARDFVYRKLSMTRRKIGRLFSRGPVCRVSTSLVSRC